MSSLVSGDYGPSSMVLDSSWMTGEDRDQKQSVASTEELRGNRSVEFR